MPDEPSTDWELLQSYLTENSQCAFRKLVERNGDLVYSACYRVLGQKQLAEEATQSVFILLLEKAHKLKADVILSNWLYKSAIWKARNLQRSAQLRMKRENTAAEETSHSHTYSTPLNPLLWGEISPHLDSAINALPEKLQNTIILCFLQNKSQRETAQILNCSESAISRRITQALSKLEKHLTRAGVALPTVGIATVITAHSTEAAAPAIIATLSKSLTIPTATTLTASSTFTSGTLISFFTMKKTLIATTALVAITGASYVALNKNQKPPTTGESTTQAPVATRVEDGTLNKVQTELEKQQLLNSALNAQLAALQADFDQEKALRSEVERELQSLDQEMLVSYGSLKEAGSTLGEYAKEMRALRADVLKQFDESKQFVIGPSTAGKKLAAHIRKYNEIWALTKGMIGMDNQPNDAALLQSSYYAKSLDLNSTQQEQLHAILKKGYENAIEQGLDSNNKPEENTKEWREKQKALNDNLLDQIKPLLTPAQLEEIDLSKQNLFRHWSETSEYIQHY